MTFVKCARASIYDLLHYTRLNHYYYYYYCYFIIIIIIIVIVIVIIIIIYCPEWDTSPLQGYPSAISSPVPI